MKKSKLISFFLTLIIWAGLFYYFLPAINIKNQEFWSFAIILIIVGVVVNSYSIVRELIENKNQLTLKERLKQFKITVLIVGGIAVFYIAGSLFSSPIIRASSYRSLLKVQTSNFKEDIKEVNYSQIPILDSNSAALLSEREMGSMIDMVSQYEVSNYYSQINYQNKPFRVTPLEYSSLVKWLTNRKVGIPAYITIDMTTQDVNLIKLNESIRISPSEHFGRNLDRYVRFKYPTSMFARKNFEIDDNGTPFWICPVIDKTIGLFGGTDIKGAVILNAVTGEHVYYDINDMPTWVDKVYDAELLVQQYDYYGILVNGYINSIFGQRGCLQTTEGYNYIALNDDVWVYTGITSVTGDESIVGFVLMNQRTKETNYYQVSGAKEFSAMSSAEGQVQHLNYRATFPLLLNVGGEPTYFLALKDGGGLVKKYAMVNVERYQIVAIGDTVAESERNYKNLMTDSGVITTPQVESQSLKGVISNIWNIVIEGNTYYYFMLEENDNLFEIAAKENIGIIKAQLGDLVDIKFYNDGREGVFVISEFTIPEKKVNTTIIPPSNSDLEDGLNLDAEE